jgi:hypothetical protein
MSAEQIEFANIKSILSNEDDPQDVELKLAHWKNHLANKIAVVGNGSWSPIFTAEHSTTERPALRSLSC